jgi:hypothetical protein
MAAGVLRRLKEQHDMALMARKTASEFERAPEGTQQGVCVEVVDLGLHPNPYQPGKRQHKVLVMWQLMAETTQGHRHTVAKRYTLSLDDRAVLRHDLESWRGQAFTAQELDGFDLMTVIGANALLNVQHKSSGDGAKTYANVMGVMPLVKGMAKMQAAGYTRPEYVAKMIGVSVADTQEPDPEERSGPIDDEFIEDQIPF